MQLNKIALADTRSFSTFFLDYLSQKESLKKFYHRFPEIQNFNDQIDEKSNSFSQANREVLSETLSKQYQGIKISEQVAGNIKSIASTKTFTITTGHQL